MSPPERSPHPLRVLLADDNHINQRLGVAVIQQLGHRVTVVSDGLEALAAVERETFDVVLLDLEMPNLDGVGAAQAIHARHGADRPYLLALSASTPDDVRQACLSAGMDAFLSKPFSIDALARALAQVPVRGS